MSTREEILGWITRFGAVGSAALAEREQVSVARIRGVLLGLRRLGLLDSERVLDGRLTLYFATREGMRVCGEEGLELCRPSPKRAAHMLACAHVAAALERAYPDQRVQSERELLRAERERGEPCASAELAGAATTAGAPRLHRPDLVLWPRSDPQGLPVAVEVELSVKGSGRLLEICRGWGQSARVAGVLYLVTPQVQRPLARAIEQAHAQQRIAVVPLRGAFPGAAALERAVSSAA